MAGSTPPPRRSLIAIPSGKHRRGQAAAAAQGQRVRWAHHLEELEQLPAGGLLVPFAITLEQGEQLVDRGLPVPAPEQRCSELETRLMVVRALRQARPQLAGRSDRLLRLLGELESGAGCGDLGVRGTLLRNAVEKLFGLGEIAARNRRPGKTPE